MKYFVLNCRMVLEFSKSKVKSIDCSNLLLAIWKRTTQIRLYRRTIFTIKCLWTLYLFLSWTLINSNVLKWKKKQWVLSEVTIQINGLSKTQIKSFIFVLQSSMPYVCKMTSIDWPCYRSMWMINVLSFRKSINKIKCTSNRNVWTIHLKRRLWYIFH